MNSKVNFEKNWDKFIKQLKGKLIAQRTKRNFSYPVLKLILAEAVTVWETNYDECGRWLLDYDKENPEKAALIKNILLKDMRFTEIPKKKDASKGIALAVSAAAAAVGFGICTYLDKGMLITAASTVLPAAAAYPAVTVTSGMMKEKNDDDIINAYLGQLEKFRISIIDVIES